MKSISWADAAKQDLANIDDWYEQRDTDNQVEIVRVRHARENWRDEV